MRAHRHPLIRLESLRHSIRMVVFAMVIVLLRMGMVAACAPSDVIENMHVAQHAFFDDSTHTEDSGDQKPCGDCLHASCHLAMTLPANSEIVTVELRVILDVFPLFPRANAPPGLSLRPPIV